MMKKYRLFLLIGLACLLLLAGDLVSQAYTLDWWTVDSGGGVSQAGESYQILAVLGQADAGILKHGDEFSLAGGFLHGESGSISPEAIIWLPLIMR